MTTDNIGRARGTDYFLIAEQLTESELDYLRRTQQFVDHEVLPVINDYWERAEFPFELIEKLAKLDIVGDGIEGYGCPPMSPIAAGLVNMELNRGDGSLGTFYGVHCGLAMKSISMLGSEQQKQRWLPQMARLEKIGAFALTEPAHGSDSIALETSARRDGDDWVLNGRKRWIGNGSIADVVVVWARDEGDGQVKGFLVEKDTAGYHPTVIEGKVALRSVWNADIVITDCRVPEANRLVGGELVQGHRPGSQRDAQRGGVGVARARCGRIRDRRGVCEGAPPVRQAAGWFPAGPGQAGEDAV